MTKEELTKVKDDLKEIVGDFTKGIFKAGTCTILFTVFLTLKLAGVITWSWWWVTAPLWGGIALTFLFIVILTILIYCIYLLSNKK